MGARMLGVDVYARILTRRQICFWKEVKRVRKEKNRKAEGVKD